MKPRRLIRIIRGIIFIVILGALLSVAACAKPALAPEAPAKEELPKIEWKFSSEFSAATFFHDAYYGRMFDRVRELTDGGMDITLYPAGELGFAAADYLRLIKDRTVEAIEFNPMKLAGVEPAFGIGNLPFFVLSWEEAEAVRNALLPLWQKVCAADWNGKVVYAGPISAQHIFSKTPIRTVDDLKGMKIRIYTWEHAEMLKAAEASAVSMTMAEVYGAGQRGIIDGALTSVTTALSDHYWEIFDYCDQMHIVYPIMTPGVIINMDAFNELPKEYQDAIILASEELMEVDFDILQEVATEEEARLKDYGMQFVEFPRVEAEKMAELSQATWGVWAAKAGSLGYEAMSVATAVLEGMRAK